MPHHLLLNITTFCNALCEFCIVYDSLNKPHLNMTDEQIFGALDQGRKDGAVSVGYSGGEPTVHKRFTEIVQYAKDIGYEQQSINTNGIKFKKQQFCEDMVKAGLNNIDFSIHGHTDEMHDKLVDRKGALEACRQAAGHLNALQDEYDFRMSATIVLTRDNSAHLLEICQFLDELGFGNKRLKYAYEGSTDHEALIAQVAPYQEVVPSLQAALDYLATQHKGFHLTHVPLCLLGDHAVFSNDFHRQDTLMVFRNEAEFGEPAHRFRQDSDTCDACVLHNHCTRLDGRYEAKHGRPELRPFKSVEEVDELFERGKARLGDASSIIAYTHRTYKENLKVASPTPEKVNHPRPTESSS